MDLRTRAAFSARTVLICCAAMVLRADSASGQRCCESYYYCYDVDVLGIGCEADQTREFPSPHACNVLTQQCDVPAMSASSCVGDCDRSGGVDVSELVRAVTFTTGMPTGVCGGFGNSTGTGDEGGILLAVTRALHGCPVQRSVCGGAPPRTDASLCGPPDRPCAVLVDNNPPGSGAAFAVDAHGRPGLLTMNDVAAVGFAELTDGIWHVSPTGFSGSPVWLDLGDSPLALVTSITSDRHVDLIRRRADGQWERVDTADGVSTGPTGVQRDAGGCLHLLASTIGPGGYDALAYVVRTDFWSHLGYATRTGTPTYHGLGGIGLDGVGDPFVAYWEPEELDHTKRTLIWRAPSGPAESVTIAVGRLIVDESTRIAFSGDGAGQAHILATRTFPGIGDQFGVELVYGARKIPGSAAASAAAINVESMWSTQVLAQGSPDEYDSWRCEAPPFPGSVCPFSYDYVRPVGIVASRNGDVRLLYLRQHLDGRYVADCSFGTCRYDYESSVDGALYIAWPENGSLSEAVVLDHVAFDGGRAVLDAAGRIHVLLPGYGSGRYLLLGTGEMGAGD